MTDAPLADRSAGVLLHVSSLPGRHGGGDLGACARAFVDLLVQGEQRIWQMLPVCALGSAASPYSAISAFAGEPRFIALDELVEQGLLLPDELPPSYTLGRTDYELAHRLRIPCLAAAYARFSAESARFAQAFEAFREREAYWLEDFAIYEALRRSGQSVSATAPAWQRARAHVQGTPSLTDALARVRFEQFLFDHQWSALHAYARAQGVWLMGDIPIFVAGDSVDVVAHPGTFKLRPDGSPRVVSGVPPDYFSEDGQRWGTPVYDVESMARDGYRFFVERFRSALSRFDVARIDHFIGFAHAWEVPAEAPTARTGQWVRGPGRALFDAARAELGPLQLVAEDLGSVSDEVIALRDGLGYPGMRILQFGFETDARDPFLPHNYHCNTVAYTGTHDNDTWLGFRDAPAGAVGAPSEAARARAAAYLGITRSAPARDWRSAALRALYGSVARTVILPLQDVLMQGGGTRMNVPGTMSGNFLYRAPESDISAYLEELASASRLYGRSRSKASPDVIVPDCSQD